MVKIRKNKKNEGFLKPFHFAEQKKKKQQRRFFVVLVVVFVLLLVIKGLWFSPLSDAKAVKRAQKNIQNNAYCSGYNNNTADYTRFVVFRDNITDEVVDSFEVSWDMADKIYHEEI